MQLTVADAAKALNVAESTVARWIDSGALPAYRVAGQYRLNRAALFEWAASKRLAVADPDAPLAPAAALPPLSAALRLGGVCPDIPGDTVPAVLEAFVARMALPESVDRALLLQALLAREQLQSTGVGGGVAIPHLRNPSVLGLSNPLLFVAYLSAPVDYAALDSQPVHTLFCPLSPSLRVHLHLLARIAWALRHPPFADAIRARAPADALLAVLPPD